MKMSKCIQNERIDCAKLLKSIDKTLWIVVEYYKVTSISIGTILWGCVVV